MICLTSVSCKVVGSPPLPKNWYWFVKKQFRYLWFWKKIQQYHPSAIHTLNVYSVPSFRVPAKLLNSLQLQSGRLNMHDLISQTFISCKFRMQNPLCNHKFSVLSSHCQFYMWYQNARWKKYEQIYFMLFSKFIYHYFILFLIN